jgi:hypothetical protein
LLRVLRDTFSAATASSCAQRDRDAHIARCAADEHDQLFARLGIVAVRRGRESGKIAGRGIPVICRESRFDITLAISAP